MKQSEKIAICLASGLMLSASARGVTTDAPGNPYQSIVERNVFALKPAPDPESLKPQAPPPPPIELQGITSMFGRKQVLFGAMMPGSKPGEPPRKTPMVLSVGEREGEIEVLEINEAAGTVKFNNHGTEEIKDLAKDSAKVPPGPLAATVPGISAPAVPGVPPARAGAYNPVPAAQAAGSSVTTFGGSAGSTLKNIPTRTVRGPMATAGGGSGFSATPTLSGGSGLSAAPTLGSGGSLPSTPATATTQPPQQRPLTLEEQSALMLIHREQHKDEPHWPPMPPIPGVDD
ncbi:MAG: hypothetical protein MUF81_02450 [Verrucomicrobia bacterium]|jgi:hypothetical protein|nr:hypothetical protein [Verrucomicrobiota bacterium]